MCFVHYPENMNELREIISSARERGACLVPLSSAAPHIHGGSSNERAETVSFEKMKKIMAINRHDRYVRVEAGVSFAELLPQVKAAGLRLNMPFLPRSGKSVVASALEREGVLLPKYQFDYTDPLLNAGIIYGGGEEMRTGSAAGPIPMEESRADMVSPWGPGTVDYMRFLMGAQGTMGLVGWATLKAEIAPSVSRLFFVEADELEILTSLASELLFRRIPDDCIILNNVSLAAAFTDGGEEESAAAAAAASWTLICRICGYERYGEERLNIYEGYLRDCCREFGARCKNVPGGGETFAEKIDSMLGECDSRETYWKMRRGAVEEILFLAPPSKAAAITKLGIEALKAQSEKDLGIIIQPQVQGRAFRVEFELMHSGDEAVAERVWEAEKSLFAAGAFFDRPYGKLSEFVFSKDSNEVDIMRKMKKLFDPDDILNPGKLCF
ncbi:MAG: FAD-binding oxidoreductase [Ruminococcaceae bacterium]|nr:FAD-binding oxidoreductase [Oscillospiraceae bacterium]